MCAPSTWAVSELMWLGDNSQRGENGLSGSMRFTPTPCIFQDAVEFILYLNGTCGQELVVLHTLPPMFGKFLVHARRVEWRFERRTFYIGSLRFKLVVASNQEVLNCVWPSVNRYWSLFIQTQTLPPNGNHKEPTPHEKSHWAFLVSALRSYIGPSVMLCSSTQMRQHHLR